MFIETPPRQISKYFDGNGPRPATLKKSEEQDTINFVKAFREVCERDNRTCFKCGAEYLYQPRLKMWVVDSNEYFYDASNLKCVCHTCARSMVAEERRLSAEENTSIIRAEVIEREASRCVYCTAGPLRGSRPVIVPRVERADPEDAYQWACSCRTCANERGHMSHIDFMRHSAEKAAELAAYLWEEVHQLE